MAEIRREKFNKQGKIARDLADLALQEIDEALNGYAEVADMMPRLEPLPDGQKRPGEIGGVVVQLSFGDRMSNHPRLFDPDSPDAA